MHFFWSHGFSFRVPCTFLFLRFGALVVGGLLTEWPGHFKFLLEFAAVRVLDSRGRFFLLCCLIVCVVVLLSFDRGVAVFAFRLTPRSEGANFSRRNHFAAQARWFPGVSPFFWF